MLSYICNFGIFVPIFMKFSPKCRTKKFRMIYTILGSFCSFSYWEGAEIWPQYRPRKIPGIYQFFLTMTNYWEGAEIWPQYRPRKIPGIYQFFLTMTNHLNSSALRVHLGYLLYLYILKVLKCALHRNLICILHCLLILGKKSMKPRQ